MTQTRLASRTSEGQAELYNTVKAMAVRFDFKPGERINEVELARRLNVSRTPLREVLNQLMVEGFLTWAVNRGFIARLLDAKQIHSLYEYRAVLESGIVRAAANAPAMRSWPNCGPSSSVRATCRKTARPRACWSWTRPST